MSDAAPSAIRSFAEAHERAGQGEDLSRIVSLSDGIFAFAMTLLVIQLAVPVALCSDLPSSASGACDGRLAHVLQSEYPAFFGYVTTFVFIGVWWQSHNRVFRFIERHDSTLVWLNLIFLLSIAIAPFVLGVYAEYNSTVIATVLFALEQSASGFLLAAIWWYANEHRMVSPRTDPAIRTYLLRRSTIIGAIFLLSIPVAIVDVRIAAFVWVGAFVASFYLRRYASV